jgi:hypothetical protein
MSSLTMHCPRAFLFGIRINKSNILLLLKTVNLHLVTVAVKAVQQACGEA